MSQEAIDEERLQRPRCDTRGIVVGPPYRPVDALTYPRFSGIRTFMRLPHVTDLRGVDAVVYGIPFDTATSFRTGQRYGPEGIRSASVLLRPYHSAFEIDVCDELSIVDYGDARSPPAIRKAPTVASRKHLPRLSTPASSRSRSAVTTRSPWRSCERLRDATAR